MNEIDRNKKTYHSSRQAVFIKKRLVAVGVICIWILIWKGISLWIDQELLIPSPEKVFLRLASLTFTSEFWMTALVSVLRISVGFVAGAAIGVILAILTSLSSIAYTFFQPVLSIIKATPVASFIILTLVWMKSGHIPAFISFLMVFPIIWGNVFKGIHQTDPHLLEMARVYRLNRKQIVKSIYFHSVLPYFTSAATTSMGLAWKAGIAAEVLSTPQFSIGGAIHSAKIYLETVDLFAWSIVVILMSVFLEYIMMRIIRKLERRQL